MKKNKNNDVQYRRGIVLGLTFAELLMLLLFVVLLVLGVTLKRSADISNKQYSENELNEISSLASMVKNKNKSSYDEVTKLLRDGNEEKAYIRLIETLSISSIDTKHQFSENDISTINVVFSLIKKINPEAYIKIQQHLKLGEAEKAYRVMVESSNVLSDCRATNKHLVQIMKVSGKGGDLPSCWHDEDGKKQYLYNIDLTDSGIVIHDNIKLSNPSRTEEKLVLPLNEFKFGMPMQPNDFIKAGQKIKKQSDEQSCRYFVKISDKTGPNSKEHYKKLRNAVEQIFYKKDI